MYMRKIFYSLLILCGALSGAAQTVSHRTENLVIFTLDGMRWQEVFGDRRPVEYAAVDACLQG